MADSCKNEFTITGPKDDIDRMLEAVKGVDPIYEEELEFNFNSIIPAPEEVINDSEKLYEWARLRWGTQSSADHIEVFRQSKETAVIWFETEWDPPIRVIRQLAKQFPSLYIKHEYNEITVYENCDEYNNKGANDG